MGEHYYSSNPKVVSNPNTLRFQLKNLDMTFISDSGVFSKSEVDFGTRLLIETFELPTINGAILDVGCGYGPIGITFAKAYSNRKIFMVDVNERALELSKKNSQINKVDNLEILKSNLFDELTSQKFAAIISNPPIRAGKKIVHLLFEQAYDHLLDQGELWIVIQKKQGAPSAIDKLKSLFSDVETVNKDKGYFIIKATK